MEDPFLSLPDLAGNSTPAVSGIVFAFMVASSGWLLVL